VIIKQCGDSMLLVELEPAIDPVINERAILLAARIRDRAARGVRDVAPGYATVGVHFDPLQTDLAALERAIESEFSSLAALEAIADRNVIEIPGNRLFVTEACSGLRSLTALLSIGFLMGGLWLNRFWSRALLIVLAIPIAVVINGVRVFLTGFLVYFVDPKMGQGFMHMTEGWLLFLVSLVLIGIAAGVLAFIEKRVTRAT
jgi:exosortase